MYFNAEAQSRVLTRFAFALSDGGYLFLGRAETVDGQNRGVRTRGSQASHLVQEPGRERVEFTPRVN